MWDTCGSNIHCLTVTRPKDNWDESPVPHPCPVRHCSPVRCLTTSYVYQCHCKHL